MIIPFLSLQSTNKPYQDDLKRIFSEKLEKGWFILGQELVEFENRFASYCETNFCLGVANGLDALTIILKACKYPPQAEVIVEQEASRFMADWERRRNGPVIARLNQEFETKRKSVVTNLLSKLNGKLSKEDKDYIEGAFRLLQNQFLHGPISALAEEMQKGNSSNHSLIDALRKLFRLKD